MTVSTSGPITRHHVGARLSETAVHHGTVYLAGQIPENHPDGDMRVQTQEVLGHVERLLNEAGSSKAHILSCNIFIRNAADITVMNEVWDAWIVPGHTPPRCTVIAPAINPQYLIEVVVIGAQIAA
ncbi:MULTISPECIES: RidA family protein [Comamonas]|jgi:enamine deaminase RidA (YjgF/YER057c/UK114 family)|uniref:RidA family protein n=1 Tax=Comamonas terrigena TaxID=32013 RepID=A0A2A7UQV8_COMTR|nr:MULTISPECIES: RidA family protein [Comamonas]MBD9532831.1 RidA family protein [Comamonas sp. CMM01]MBV7419109.1 RidA family protein [Comamonas sp. CMM03]MDH0048712.1 RidA family protein [Comamonas terrigena]MDH0511692.1 RidA family protein [Comamonas terrigena]MDH1090850.1 RidA family protein [Comamonas terrigena]